MKNFKQNPQNGFTLIEVLVVILIIVTLVGVVVGIAQLGHNKSAEAQCISQLGEWRDALETYKERTGDYPADDNLKDGSGLQTVINVLYPTTNDKHSLQIRDPWGMEFRFRRVNKQRYQLGSLGMDRLIGSGIAIPGSPAADPNASAYKHMGQGDDITNSNGRM